jgi:protein TonB
MEELAGAEPSLAAGETGSAEPRSAPPILTHVFGRLTVPPIEPRHRRVHTLLCASLSLLLHGTALAAMLMIVHSHTKLGAISIPSQAISVEIVSSQVLESMHQTATDTEAAEAAESNKAGEEPSEASKKVTKAEPPEKEPIEEAAQDSGKIASAETEIKEAAPQKSNETGRQMPKPLTDEPAPIVMQPPPVTEQRPSESDGEKETARAHEMAEQARKEAQRQQERIEREARGRRQRELEEERRRAERKREAERREEERKEQQRKRVDKGGATSKGATAAQKQSSRASASAGSIVTYGSQVRARVANHKPSGAGERGTAMVAFRITSSGGLSYASISRSSGSAVLDRLAIAAVRGAAPFPQPPAGASPSQLHFTIPFHFQ